MDDGDIKQLMQEIEFVLKRNQNEKYLRAILTRALIYPPGWAFFLFLLSNQLDSLVSIQNIRTEQ